MSTPSRLLRLFVGGLAAAVVLGLALALPLFPEPDQGKDMKAPDFPDGLEWLNTDKPLHLADLRGKILLLDFWTFG